MKITFKSIEYKNFKSVGASPIKIKLDSHNTTLLAGKNGHGKSTFLSALCFSLFGKGYGKVTKPELINSINQKQLLTTVEFSIGKKDYKVIRGIKPNIFEIYEGDTLKNQDPTIKDYQKVLEQQILGFNYRAFTQVVTVGGQEYTPFMKLPAKERRLFVEDLLDIKIFSLMASELKVQIKDAKSSLSDNTLRLESTKEKILLQKSFIEKLDDDTLKTRNNLKLSLSKCAGDNESHLKSVELLNDKILRLTDDVKNEARLTKFIDNLSSEVDTLTNKSNTYSNKKESYDEIDDCPTCYQKVGSEHKDKILSVYDDKIGTLNDEIDANNEKLNKAIECVTKLQCKLAEYNTLNDSIREINSEVHANNKLISSLQKSVDETNNNNAEDTKLKEFLEEFKGLKKVKESIILTLEEQKLLLDVLSDNGIKSKIIKQYVPTINHLINQNLEELDLFVSFHLDENFNEKILSRHRDNFTYNSFSDGQKRRIDVAILFAWIKIAQAKNSINTNLLVLDELDASLDSEGSEMFLELVKKNPTENIFIVSHKKELLVDKVDNNIEFEIKNNFSQVKVDK